MKRCPKCNRVETDDALAFCRSDGAPLIESSPEAITASAATEADTTILPHTVGNSVRHFTAPITLPEPASASRTGKLPASRRWIRVTVPAVLFIGVAVASVLVGYFYLSNRNSGMIQSVAVMPFVNASGNGEVEYLSDGLSESLINSLSRLPNLSVKARSTVFRYKGRDISPEQVGSELSVEAVLNGRIVQRGDQLIVSVDLVNARNGDQIWGQKYTANMSDVVSLQAELANELSRKLQADISREDREKLNKGSTTNPEAYLLYLKGRYQTAKYTKDGIAKGLEYFNQAIALDPHYALAYDGIADNYIAAADWYVPAKEALPKTAAASKKALEIDDQLAEAHASLATVHWWFDWDWAAADAEFRRAIELSPNDARVHGFYAWFLISVGRIDEAIAENNRARQLDPLSVETNTIVGQTLHFARHHEEAIRQLQSTLEMDENYWLAHSILGRSYQQQGKHAEAIVEFQRALDLERDVPENFAMLANAYAVAGKAREAEKLLEQLQDISTKRYVPPYNLAVVYVGLGKKDQAFTWLERAYADHSFYITWLKYDPQLDSLRSDPRFSDLARRAGFR